MSHRRDMADENPPAHNGHHDVPNGVEQVRSGFDRRKNWGESVENLYKRIDHRIAELVQKESISADPIITDSKSRAAWPLLFVGGLVVGIWIGRRFDRY